MLKRSVRHRASCARALAARPACRRSSSANFDSRARRDRHNPMILLFLALAFTANQGSAVQLTFPDEPGVKAVEVVWQNKKIPAFHVQNSWTTILGVDLDAKAGEQKADVFFTMQDGRLDKRDAVIRVISKKYPTTELKVEEKYVELSKAD